MSTVDKAFAERIKAGPVAALKPTKEGLQASALDLVQRIIRLEGAL